MLDIVRFTALLWLSLAAAAGAFAAAVHHDLEVIVEPATGVVEVVDRIRLPSPEAARDGFWLHEAFAPVSSDGVALAAAERDGPSRRYVVEPDRELTVRYRGRLAQRPPPGVDAGFWPGFAAGHVGPEGVFLGAASEWVPRFGRASMTFTLVVSLPPGWHAVSQGTRAVVPGTDRWRWEERQPQQSVVLVANRFTRYSRPGPVAGAQVWLREPDQALADRYLDATERYLGLYSGLLGEYPYAKFALVENFWETGYGMPSFTMLGPRVVRLPFILHSSYPHEILHSWWGSSVYVDWSSGNWSEGLTAYLADHLVAEARGRGVAHRRAALAKYRDWVRGSRDFALRDFRGKHDTASEAVGYNKALLFFHMLRTRLGNDRFVAGLRRFYAQNRFAVAGYADIRAAFEAVSGEDLSGMFEQWIERPGAPRIELDDLRVEPEGAGYRLAGTLRQSQPGAPYRLDVPVAVQLDGVAQAHRLRLRLEGRERDFVLTFARRPRRMAVDPGFDLFRRLDPAESPPALSALLGAEDAVALPPADAPAGLRAAYRALAARLGVRAIREDDAAPPADRATWILGWENRHRSTIEALFAAHGVAIDADGVRLASRSHDRAAHCVVLVAHGTVPVGWVGCDRPEAFAGLGRKLPHYGRYGYLAFEGAAPRNIHREEWEVIDSPLNVALVPGAERLSLPPRSPLAEVPAP